MNRRTFLETVLASAAAAPFSRSTTTLAGRGAAQADGPSPLELWFSRAASKWVEALPVGNGRLGAMVFGGTGVERLQLNDDTLWSGGPSDWNTPGAKEALTEIRALVLAGRFAEADRASKRLMGPFTQSYLPLADLLITFDHGNLGSDYRRGLDLRSAVASVGYRTGTVHYTREVIASHPADVIAVRLTADRPGMLQCHVRLSSALRHTVTADRDALRLLGQAPSHVDPSYYDTDEPVLYGRVPAHGAPRRGPSAAAGTEPSAGGMRFEARVGAAVAGGEVSIDGDGLHVRGASAVTLIVAAGTSFNGHDRSPAADDRDPAAIAGAALAAALNIPWEDLRRAHEADHRALFDRVSLDLGAPIAGGRPPIADAGGDASLDRRIASAGAGDPRLVELLFQYGRYLLIACSRPGSQPANLQGLWNEEMRAPWSSNYTININTQMNYWPAETTALPELHEPLITMVEQLSVNGTKTAARNYGARGWVAHHNTDVWRQSGMVGDWGTGDPVWALWPMAGPWLSQHLYERFLFGGDLRVPARPRLSRDARRGGVLSRLADRGWPGAPRDGAVHVARAQVPHADR